MTIKTILENIVTKFSGDARELDRTLRHVEQATQQTVRRMERHVSSAKLKFNFGRMGIGGFASGPGLAFGNVSNQAKRMQMGFGTGPGLPFANVAKRMSMGFGTGPGLSFGSVAGYGSFGTFGAPGMPGGGGGRGGGGGGGIAAAAGGGWWKSFQNGSYYAGAFFNKFNKGARRFWYDCRMMGFAFKAYVVAPIVGLLAGSAYAFAKFDDQMKRSSALFGNMSKSMENQMGKDILNMSKNSRLGPQQLAEMMTVLASANYSPQQATGLLGVAEKFTVASGMKDAAEATKLLIGVQSALGMRVTDNTKNMANMTHVAGLLAQANALAAGEIEDFAKALTNKSAASLRMFGKSGEEGLAVLAAYAMQETKAQKAGTNLDIVLREMTQSVIKHTKVWEMYAGKNAVFDKSGNLLNLADILINLENAFAGMSHEQQLSAMMQMGFQAKSAGAVRMLFGMGKQIKFFEEHLMNSDAALERMYKENMRSFLATLEKLKNLIHAVAIELGELLRPELEFLTMVVRGMIRTWSALPNIFKRMIVYTGILVIGIGMLIGALALIGGIGAGVASAWGGVVFVWGVLSTQIAWLLFAVPGLAAAFAALFTWPVIIGAAIVAAFVAAGVAIYTFWDQLTGLDWFGLADDISKLWVVVVKNMGFNIGVLAGAWINSFAAVFGYIWNIDFPKFVVEGLMKAVQLFWNFGKTVASIMASALFGQLGGLLGFQQGLELELNKTLDSFQAGAKAKNLNELSGVLSGIFSEAAKDMKSLGDGFEGKVIGKKIKEEIVSPLEDANKELKKFKDNLLGLSTIEGILFDSAEGFDAIRDHLKDLNIEAGDAGALNRIGADTGLAGVINELRASREEARRSDSTKPVIKVVPLGLQ